MVDEYQDVSRVQDAIFAAVSRAGKNLFMVGDVKQSIYRFRLADPAIFTEKYLSYSDYESAKPPSRAASCCARTSAPGARILDGQTACSPCACPAPWEIWTMTMLRLSAAGQVPRVCSET